MSAVPNLDLRPDHWAIVRDALSRHVPDREVLAFGSRATWTAKDYSDLDLAIMGEEPLSLRASSALDEDLVESELPFRVDIVDWASTDESFRRVIRRGAVSVQAPTVTPDVAQRVGIRSTTPVARGLSGQDTKEDNGGLFSPTFPEHWRPSPLYAMATWVNGLAFRKIQFSDTGRPIIKIAELKGGISGQTKFTQQTFDESVRVRPGDLLFSWSGQPETSIDAFWWRGPEGWLNQHVFRVTPELGLDVTFFYYLLRYLKPNFVRIARDKQTTGLGHVTKRDLKNLRVASPARPEQRAIAHVLGALDDKIELNRRMNETLEAMTRALFKSWFVDFDPVRAKMKGRDTGLPRDIAALFPDRLVDSEMGEIPEGWEVKSLKDCMNLTMGQSPPGSTYNDHGDGLPFFQGRSEFGFRYPEKRRFCSAPTRVADPDDTLVSVRAPVGDINLAWERCCIGRGVAALRHKSGSSSFTYHSAWALQRELKEYEHTGTVFGAINKGQFQALKVTEPDPRVVEAFDAMAVNLDARIRSNTAATRTLAGLRDTILPTLISGEIRVPAAERLVESVS